MRIFCSRMKCKRSGGDAKFSDRNYRQSVKAFPSILVHWHFAGIARCRQFQETRKKALEDVWCRLEEAIHLMWPDASLVSFGSYASSMMTPDSDVDLVVSKSGRLNLCVQSRLLSRLLNLFKR